MKKDMTSGSPFRLILLFSIPLLIGNVFQQLYSMADTIIVGNTISAKALGAVGCTGGISFLVIGFVQGITSGFSVVTAQRFGAGDEDGVRRSVGTSILLCVGVTVVVTAISVLACRPLLELMSTPADIIDDAYSYIVVNFAGIGATVLFNLFSSILRALGDSLTPLVFLVIACIINVGLDFALILWGGMGVAGAGWATVIAQLISGVLCVIYSLIRYPILRLKRSDWKLNLRFCWEHLRIALPMAFQFSVTAVGVIVLQSALNGFEILEKARLGESYAVAAFAAASKIDQLATQPLLSFGVAMATYSAQNYGAGRIDRIKAGVKSCSILSTCFAVAGGVLMNLFGKNLVYLFATDIHPDLIQKAQTYLLITGSFYTVLGFLFIFRNVLQGIGSSTVPLIAGFIELVLRSAVAFFLAGPAGYVGICFAGPIAWWGAAIPLAIAYFVVIRRLGNYQRHPTQHSEEPAPQPS